MSYALTFLGVGNAFAVELGASSAVFERDGRPSLMIDCGQEALSAYLERYGEMPGAVYLTHVHFDHVAGLERLLFGTWFDEERHGRTKIYVHAAIVPYLQERVANYPGVLAEGGANWWDGVRLVPCSRGFWHDGLWFDLFATRHHDPMTSFGLALRGSFVYTGDTRPVPEAIAHHAGPGATIAHDCALVGNPSHTGLDDIEREYPPDIRERLVLYHYGSARDAEAMRARGYRVANAGEQLMLDPPERAHG
jgi:glyoxylase-like metal-dependent hydrolase (beta-lactamase superfamily II)